MCSVLREGVKHAGFPTETLLHGGRPLLEMCSRGRPSAWGRAFSVRRKRAPWNRGRGQPAGFHFVPSGLRFLWEHQPLPVGLGGAGEIVFSMRLGFWADVCDSGLLSCVSTTLGGFVASLCIGSCDLQLESSSRTSSLLSLCLCTKSPRVQVQLDSSEASFHFSFSYSHHCLLANFENIFDLET